MGCNPLTSIFGGGSPSITTGPTAYSQTPDFYQQTMQNLFNTGNNVATQTNPFAPPPVNSFNTLALQTAGQGTPAMGFMNGASNAFTNASNMQSQIPGQINMANGYLNDASGNLAAGTAPITAGQINQQTNQMMDPYTQNVIGSLQGTINDQLNTQLSNNNSNSTLAGAFGSDRAALANGQSDLQADRALGEQAGSLLNTQYQTANTNALNNLTNQSNRYLTAAGTNVNQAGQAISGANAYATAANSANQTGLGDLAGSQQNGANTDNKINQLTNAGNYLTNWQTQQNQVPLQQLQLLQSILGSFGTNGTGAAGASQAYQPQGLLQQLGITPNTGINGSGGNIQSNPGYFNPQYFS